MDSDAMLLSIRDLQKDCIVEGFDSIPSCSYGLQFLADALKENQALDQFWVDLYHNGTGTNDFYWNDFWRYEYLFDITNI